MRFKREYSKLHQLIAKEIKPIMPTGAMNDVVKTFRLLWNVVDKADRLESKLGTKEHPVQSWYERESLDLDLALYDLWESIGRVHPFGRCCDNGYFGKRHKCQKHSGTE